MTATPPQDSDLPLVAYLFEAALVPVALAAGWITGVHPLGDLSLAGDQSFEQLGALLWGALATLPLVAALVAGEYFPLGPLGSLRRLVAERIAPLFRSASVWQLAMISAVAGLGEEMLFRGWLQTWIGDVVGPPYGPVVGLLLASSAFAACHALSRAYAVVVLLVGLYLGLLMMVTGSVLAPVVAHSLYDFVALLWIRHQR
jgi:CAAX protease family protein